MLAQFMASYYAVAAALVFLFPVAAIPIGYYIYGSRCYSKQNLSSTQLSCLVSRLLFATYEKDLITVHSLIQFEPALINMKGTLPILVLNFQRKRTALNIAACGGHFGLVTYLLDCKADVNAKDEDGLTPLMWAVTKNDVDTTLVLLKRGADPRIKSDLGEDALSIAVLQKKKYIIKIIEKVFRYFISSCI